MDLQSQAEVKRLAEAHGSDSVVVVLGAPDPESAEIAAETVVVGDPTYAGPLAEAQLGLPVFHILEDEIRALVPDAVWDEQIGVMADVLDGSAIAEAVGKFRQPADG